MGGGVGWGGVGWGREGGSGERRESATHKHVLAKLIWQEVIQKSRVLRKAVQDTSNGVGVKEQDGCSQDGGKHAVVQNS